ncbi:dihydrofolate reductase family protein [Arthrobacter sp. YD2]|uniref:dihydrofolate reductase family protein n=1 Tax=Arthrobacter sp. YD2 TaxID=3058046 RepID=UPI0025B5CF83|nr:dihydrofolate reductase family protein [Arthrobacter sp. YD2]MDN3904948.1 dihydrofolate reductase family protein [Arthrobacter sp. YD2]
MRKVTSALFSSVDGVVESPNLWQFDHFDEEMGPAMEAALSGMDTVLMGRSTYEQWADYWPDPAHDDEFGLFINPVRKYVASRTLEGPLEWENSSLIDGDLEDFVADLRTTEGGTIGVQGSISVVRQLLFAGLLDELTLMVHPVVAGSGQRLFRPEDPTTRLELKNSQVTSSGNALLTYGLRSD